MLTLIDAKDILTQYNKWRTTDGEGVKMPKAKDITEAIEIAIECIEAKRKNRPYSEAEKKLEAIKTIINK